MKTRFLSLALVVLGSSFGITAALRAEDKPAATAPAAAAQTCVVSGDELGSMGKPVEYVYKQEGQPDRVIQLCCKGCVKDFKKDPAKYLAKLDAANAVAPAATAPATAPATPAKAPAKAEHAH